MITVDSLRAWKGFQRNPKAHLPGRKAPGWPEMLTVHRWPEGILWNTAAEETL